MSGVFLSYATTDGAERVVALADALEAAGRRCWRAPRDVTAGRPYAGQIVSAIRSCDALVVLATAGACASADVLQEIQVAHSAKKLIIPILFAEVALSDDLEYYLSARHQLRWLGGDATARQVVTALDAAAPAAVSPQARKPIVAAPVSTASDSAETRGHASPPQDAIVGRWFFSGFDDNVARCVSAYLEFKPDGRVVPIENDGEIRAVEGVWRRRSEETLVEIGPSASVVWIGDAPKAWTLLLNATWNGFFLEGRYAFLVDPDEGAADQLTGIYMWPSGERPEPLRPSLGAFKAIRT